MDPQQIGQRHRARAGAALDAGRFSVAEREARAALAINPRDVNAQLFLCRAYLGLGTYDKAIDSARAALSVSPGDGYGHYLLGFALQVAGKAHEAVEQLREAVRLHPSAPRYYARLAIALTDARDKQGARSAIDIALSLDTENPTLLDEASRVYGLCDALEQAEDCARKLVRLSPTDATAHWRLAWVLGVRMNHAAAAESARAALRLDPNYWPGWEEFGYSLLQQGAHDEAEWALREALRLKPGLTSATLNLAHLYSKRGFVDDAIDVCDATLELQPLNDRVRRTRDGLEAQRRQRKSDVVAMRAFYALMIVFAVSTMIRAPIPTFVAVLVLFVVAMAYLIWRTLQPPPRAPTPPAREDRRL